MHEHSESPYHTCVHCKGFVAAAPRKARTSVSVSFWGLPLSGPLWIFGLVSHYLTNNLIHRRLILNRLSFGEQDIPVQVLYPVLHSISRDYPRV